MGDVRLTARAGLRAALLAGIASAALALPALAQTPPPPIAPAAVAAQPGQRLSQEQLARLVAPIALYPDTLLTQVLVASTSPIEIVQAYRWATNQQNAQLRGEALARALESQPWDPSVKSLVPFPDVLGMMNAQLEWTEQLGTAMYAQEEEVLAAIQALRWRAREAGTLADNAQQRVVVEQNVTVQQAPGAAAPPPQVIRIEPAQPNVVYVPVVNPTVAYGTWPYSSFPPYAFPPPVGWGVGNALMTGLAAGLVVAVFDARRGWGTTSPAARTTVISRPSSNHRK